MGFQNLHFPIHLYPAVQISSPLPKLPKHLNILKKIFYDFYRKTLNKSNINVNKTWLVTGLQI